MSSRKLAHEQEPTPIDTVIALQQALTGLGPAEIRDHVRSEPNYADDLVRVLGETGNPGILQCLRQLQTLGLLRNKDTSDFVTQYTEAVNAPRGRGWTPPPNSPRSSRAPLIHSMSDVYHDGLAPVEWAVDDLLPMEAITLVSGGPKIGKTTVFLSWLKAMITQQPEWCGKTVRPYLCWLFTDEGKRTMSRAIQRVGIPVDRHMAEHRISIFSENELSWEELCEWIGDEVLAMQERVDETLFAGGDPDYVDYPPQVILIDTLGAWGELDDVRDYSKMMSKMAPVKRLRGRIKCAIVLIHHSRKTKPDVKDTPIDSTLGSQALTGQADHILSMFRHPDLSTARSIHIDTRIGDESGISMDVVMDEEGNYTQLTPEHLAGVEQARTERNVDDINGVLLSFTSEWMAMRDALAGRPIGISEHRFRGAVRVLLEQGRLATNGHAVNSPHIRYRLTGAHSSLMPVED